MSNMFTVCVYTVAAAVLASCTAAQTVHVVGDTIGWTIPIGGASAYTNWAAGKTFVVGDILTFNFETNDHDVLQVTKVSFDACTSANTIGSSITTGPANVTLDTAGENFYICTFGRHCQAGQKLDITVSASSSGSPVPITRTSMTPLAAPSPTSGTPDAACAPVPVSGPSPSGLNGGITPPGSSSSAIYICSWLSTLAIALVLFYN